VQQLVLACWGNNGCCPDGFALRFIDSSGGSKWVERSKLSSLCCFQRPCPRLVPSLGHCPGAAQGWRLAPCVSLLEGRDPSAPTSFLYVPRLKIAIRYDFRHCGRGVPAANGTGVHSRNRAITNADHAPATFARSRLPWALEE
jgi:hypothetical protein